MTSPATHQRKRMAPPSGRRFVIHLSKCLFIASGFISVALGVGMIGYHVLESLSWTDSFLNASMILGGMGPVDPMKTSAGKIFAGCYALFSGLTFIGLAGFLFTPVIHWVLHRFHYELDENS